MKNNIDKVMKILKENYPAHNKTTLNRMRDNPEAFKILISCLLSLRTQDKNTEIVSRKLFEVADTPKKILKLPIKKLEKLIFSSGHYHKKAQTLKHVSKVLLEKFNGEVPKTREELMSIKGIGPKTANIVLAFAFGKEVLPIDTHCHRIPNRLNWIETKNPVQTEAELMKILPRKHWKDFNAILVQFGKTICVPISPKCSICPVKKYCGQKNIRNHR